MISPAQDAHPRSEYNYRQRCAFETSCLHEMLIKHLFPNEDGADFIVFAEADADGDEQTQVKIIVTDIDMSNR